MVSFNGSHKMYNDELTFQVPISSTSNPALVAALMKHYVVTPDGLKEHKVFLYIAYGNSSVGMKLFKHQTVKQASSLFSYSDGYSHSES